MPRTITTYDMAGDTAPTIDWHFALSPDERIGARVRPRSSSMRSASLVLILLFAGGWGLQQVPADWREEGLSLARDLFERATAASPPVQNETAEPSLPSPAPALAEHTVEAAPGATAGLAAEPLGPPVPAAIAADAPPAGAAKEPDAGVAAPSTKDEAAPPMPLAAVTADPADPVQKRALAAGLHPALSPAVLRRLTKADFRNAASAITRALARPAGEKPLVWPRDAKTGAATFEVHFVAAADPQCRRYVVTVTLDRWSTTVPPMEKCAATPRG